VNDVSAWCEQALNYRFNNFDLLRQALTHRSAAADNNERLEFLGDAVLDLTISRVLFQQKPVASEGGLSRLRAALVRKETLVTLASEIGLSQYVILGGGEQRSGGRQRESVMANALEAVLGAVFLDGGYGAADTVILELYKDRLTQLPDEDDLKDAKTRLQELLQARQLSPPDYELLGTTGAAHAQTFEVVCRIADPAIELRATGKSRRRAEQAAAALALDKLTHD